MAVVALTSAQGSPGVTTAALTLALAWPRRVLLLEADPVGGSSILAGYLRGGIDHNRGLIHLARAHRDGRLPAALWEQAIGLPASPHAWLVPSLTQAAHASRIDPLWAPLAQVLSQQGDIDVIIDAGRIGAAHAPLPLMRAADLTLLTTRSTVPAVNSTRAQIGVMRDLLAGENSHAELQILLVGEGMPFTASRIAEGLQLPVAATLALDPVSADYYSVGPTSESYALEGRAKAKHERTPLAQSVRRAVADITATLTRLHQAAHPPAAHPPPVPDPLQPVHTYALQPAHPSPQQEQLHG